jgi:hypothetical protein
MSTSTPERPAAATSDAPSAKRRRFLFALGASSAGAAAAVAAPAVTATVAPAASALPQGRPGGYRETEHVRDYYDTTRR